MRSIWYRAIPVRCVAPVLLLTALRSGHVWSQLTPSTASQPGTSTSRTVQGQVVDALSGAAIPRALVSIAGRAVLTDAQGDFVLPQFTDDTATALVQKPGYSPTLYPEDQQSAQPIADLDQPLRLLLYPDGVLTGTLTGADGQPLEQVAISLERAQYDAQGLHAVDVEFSLTNSHGQFRFREAPGRYRLAIGYSSRQDGTGQVILPQVYPADPATQDSGFVTLAPGEQKVVDLRPALGVTYKVGLTLDATDTRVSYSLTATNSAGVAFPVTAQTGGGASGDISVQLPSGRYQLRAVLQQRNQISEATASVTVAGHDVSGVILHLSSAASLPVEVALEPSSIASSSSSLSSVTGSTTIVTAQNLNLQLHSIGSGSDVQASDLRLTQAGGAYAFLAPSGRYRLQGGQSNGWRVEAATFGQTDLLTGEVTVNANSAGSPIRVVATNKSGRVSGTVQPPSTAPSGAVAHGWVYLIAQFPCLAPFVRVGIGKTGTWTASLLPGAWAAVAVEHSIEANFREPAVASRYSSAGRSVDVADGSQVSLDLAMSSPDAKGAP